MVTVRVSMVCDHWDDAVPMTESESAFPLLVLFSYFTGVD